jgi:Flp pilus assembly pilin Flp
MRTEQIFGIRRHFRQVRRVGSTQVQTGVILALIAVGVIVGVRSLGTGASNKIASTAVGVGNPAALVGGYSGDTSGGSGGSSNGSSSGSSDSGGSGSSDGSSGGSGSDSGSTGGDTGGDTGGGICP